MIMERINVFFLHGFLGRPSDWDSVIALLPQKKNIRFFVPDYFNEPLLGPRNSFSDWAKSFVAYVQGFCSSETNVKERNILVGYSLGGRLALHALEIKPELWEKVICISTNAGFEDDFENSNNFLSEERRLRKDNDSRWAYEFANSTWENVIQKWNAQAVFGGGGKEPLRFERDYTKETLSQALTQWSLSQQRNMKSVLKKNAEKVLWVVGENDEKFVRLAEQLKLENPNLHNEKILNASHRVPFDNPEAVAAVLTRIL